MSWPGSRCPKTFSNSWAYLCNLHTFGGGTGSAAQRGVQLSGRCGALGLARLEQVLEHAQPDGAETWILVEQLLVARTLDVDERRRAERGLGTRAERDDAVREQDALVHVVGDQQHGLAAL